MDIQEKPMAINGNPWIYTDTNGYPWKSIVDQLGNQFLFDEVILQCLLIPLAHDFQSAIGIYNAMILLAEGRIDAIVDVFRHQIIL